MKPSQVRTDNSNCRNITHISSSIDLCPHHNHLPLLATAQPNETGESKSSDRQGTNDNRARYQQQQQKYSTKEHTTEGDSSSPPPHSSTTTTGTTTTPTSEVSSGSPRPSSSGSSASKPSLVSSIGPQFPHQASPTPIYRKPSHQVPSRTPAHGDIPTVEEGVWPPGDMPATAAIRSSSGNPNVVGASPSHAASSPPDESSFPAAIKMLVSNNMAGSIIGRSGQTISDLQSQSSTRIKLSQTGDYFPGTQDRVCLVQGQPENLKKAMSLLLSRLFTLQHQNHMQNVAQRREEQQQHDPRATPEHMQSIPEEAQGFSFVVRILVPSPSCGMIIGKGGSNIKQMVEASGVSSVRLSPKEGFDSSTDSSGTSAALASATSERIVTISGSDLNCCIACLFIILDGMTSHPEICRYTNMTTSYSRVMSAAYEAAASSGRTIMHVPSQDSIPRMMTPTGLWDPNYGPPSNQEQAMGNIFPAQSFDAPPPMSPSVAYQRSYSDPSALHAGFDHSPSSPHHFGGHEPVPPYSPMFGGPAPFIPPSPEYQQHSPIRASIPRSHSNTSLPFGAMGGEPPRPPSLSASAPDLLALQFQESMRMSDPHRIEPPPLMYSGPQQQGFTVQVAIPDSLIGSILGRGGGTLNELQMQSNTRIRISQRGEFVPGTKNRIVTIRGPTAQSVTVAQMLMSQRMVLPPTAVSPATAFPIQRVEPSYEQQYQHQGMYMPPQSPVTGASVPPSDDLADSQAPPS